jgi:hypothetical protein
MKFTNVISIIILDMAMNTTQIYIPYVVLVSAVNKYNNE